MRFLVAIFLVLVPCWANAAPVYLTCQMPSGNQSGFTEWHLTLDESLGTIDTVIPEINIAKKETAVFSADKVLFNGMTLSRIDLSLIRPPVYGTGPADVAKCKVNDMRQRKF